MEKEIEEYLYKMETKTTKAHLRNLGIQLLRMRRDLEKPYSALKAKDLEKYARNLHKAGLKPSSIKTKLTWLRSMEKEMGYNWGVNWKALIPRGTTLRENVEQREILTDEEIQRMIDHTEGLRNKALIAVMANTGARLNEILALHFKDVKIDSTGEITLKFNLPNTRTKDHKKEVILTTAKKLFQVYLESATFEPESRLFPISPSQTQSIIWQAAEAAKIEKRVSPHSFRHTRATNLARMPISPIQAMQSMGWRDLAMWKIYSHARQEETARQIAEIERNGKPHIEPLAQEDLKTNLERKALEAAEEKARLEKHIAELEVKLTRFEEFEKKINRPEFWSAIAKIEKTAKSK